jgi:hypothetical protein
VFFDALMVEHLVALVPGQRPPQPVREFGERADERVTDRLRGMISWHGNQDREPELPLHQGGDRRALSGADQQIALPMPGLPPRSDRGWPLMNRLHRGGLFERTVTGAAAAPAVPVGASGAQVLPINLDDQAAVDRLVEGLGTHMPGTPPPVTAPQPSADLGRRPVLGELAGHGVSQLGIHAEPARLGSSAPLVGPVVRIPRLVAAVGLAVAGDLSVDALKGLPDPCRDQLDRLTAGQPISDLDPIILR